MFRKLKSKLVAGLAAIACGACAMGVYAQAGFETESMPIAEAETAPVLTIESNNVSYADSVYILYAVAMENVDASANVQMLFWNEPQTEYVVGTQAYVAETKGSVTVHGKECLAFYSEGLSAKRMTDDVYCRAYVEVGGTAYYSDVEKYSVLQYVYDMRASGSLSAEQENMYTAMLEYGTAAQLLLIDKDTGAVYNGDRLANETYYSVSVANATFEDGFGYGLYKAGDVLTVTPAEGYEFNSETANTAFTVVDGAITLTVPTEDFTDDVTFTAIVEDPIEPPVEEEKTFTNTYTFADYAAGTQYAENEVHVLDEFVTVTVDNGHFTTQLRLYSSATNNSTAIIAASNVIDAISLNAGNKVDTLNIYGSVDGVTFTADPIATVAVTSTSYNDYEVDIDETAFYKYLKLDVAGTQQIRIASFSITIFNEGQEPEKTDEQKVAEAADAFDLGASEVVEGLTVAELPTDSGYEGVTLTWALEETEYATLEGTTLTVGNPVSDGTFTLVATFTCGEATATKSYDFQIEYVPTGDQEKLDTAMADFMLEATTVNAGEELYLNTDTGVDGVTVAWSMEDTAYATLNDNVLTAAAVNESATLNVTATFTCGGVSGEKSYVITMVGYTETLQAIVNGFSLGDDATIYLEEVVELATDYAKATISWAFAGEYTSTLVDNVLTAGNVVETLTLVATFTYNTATVTQEYTVEVIEIPVVTIAKALEDASTLAEGETTSESYCVTGTITGFYDYNISTAQSKGQFYIADESGASIIVYNINGYATMDPKPVVGYTITIVGKIHNYYGAIEFKDVDLIEATEPTDAYKVNAEVEALALEQETLIGAQELSLPTAGETFTDVAISWEVTAGGNVATVENNVLTTTNPTEDTQVTLVATLTLGEVEETKILYVTVKHLAEGEVAPATASMSVFGTTGTLASDNSSISWSSDYFDVINEKTSSSNAIRTSDSNHYRVYMHSTFKIVGTNGATITQVSVTCTSDSYATVLQNSTVTTGVTATVSGNVVTYTVESGSVEEINITMTAQARISAVEVTYLAA